jgi:hypothetical protein
MTALTAARVISPASEANQSALLFGACGSLGEFLLNSLLGADAYTGITVLARLPLPSTTRKLTTLFAPEGAPLPACPDIDHAYLVVGEPSSYYGRDEVYRAFTLDDALPAARSAKAAGVTALALVAPIDAYTHSSAFRKNLMQVFEYDLLALGFEKLVLVRPAAPERFEKESSFGKRIASFLLRQMHGLMPQNYHPPTSREIALAATAAMLYSEPGLHVIDIEDVRAQAAQTAVLL